MKADDHDMGNQPTLCPFGILDVMSRRVTIIFGVSFETSDFIVDCIETWWNDNKECYSHINQLVINLDNGPQNSSYRTQFMKRMVEFAHQNNLEIVLVFYPPYHSKYNPIERVWGILENHWNGTWLNSVATTLQWAKTMTWKSLNPVVKMIEQTYQTGVKVCKKVFKNISDQLNRHESLPKYYVTIPPQTE